MSLADQSQQWYPTSVQVTVFQARNLRIKGKNGTNDAYAIMQVAKDKFSTSVAEKCVAPIWKEEATFDLPLFHHGNTDRCTLYITVMHRALVGLDKLLGQAVINLLDLHDNTSRKKTDWFKLLDKNGKADKDRGEVLLDIQFMRNNMTASMFDLSMQDKPRSRIAKLKDKVRGKKSDGFSDSASAIVPSVSQVQSDSEGEGDAHSASPATKKKSKLKSLFAPKTNLYRNHSQSMSVLGTLPEKNSPLSVSRSSGLNVESPDVKKKTGLGKFTLGHKRTGSNDSKISQGPFSLLGRSKQSAADQNTVCINGSHIYSEEYERKTGSTLSLNSSEKGSVEDVRRPHERNISDASTDSFKALSIPSYKPDIQEKKPSVQHYLRAEEEEELEAKRYTEEKCKQMEGKRIQEMLDRQEEQEKRRLQERQRKMEEEEERKRKRDEEERKKLDEQERRQQEEAKLVEELERKRQEEARRAEEQRHHDETRVTDRLSSLFGIGKKKEEKKEEQNQENPPTATPRRSFKELEGPTSTNPFEEIPLSSDQAITIQGPAETQRGVLSPHTPSSGFPSRTAKVSAVKPRLAEWQNPEVHNYPSPTDTTNTQNQDQVAPSPLLSGSFLSSDSEFCDIFSDPHSSSASHNIRNSLSTSPRGSMENLSVVGSSATSNRKIRAMLPPGYSSTDGQYGLTAPMDTRNGSVSPGGVFSSGVERERQQQAQKPVLPLPDYETLFPKKRHGVMGQTRWDHIIAEVNQRRLERAADMSGPEMSVDGPVKEPPVSLETVVHKERSTANMNEKHQRQREAQWETSESRTVSGAKRISQPPMPTAAATPRQLDEKDTLVAKPRHSLGNDGNVVSTEQGLTKDPPVPAIRTTQINKDSDRELTDAIKADKQLPSVKPRQKKTTKEPVKHTQTEANQDENMDRFDPFPSDSFQLQDPWSIPQLNTSVDDFFSAGKKEEFNTEEMTLTADDFDATFQSNGSADPFSNPSQSGSAKFTEEDKPMEITLEKVSASTENFPKKRRAPQPPVNSNRNSGQIQSHALKPEPEIRTQSTVLSEQPVATTPDEKPWEPEPSDIPSAFQATSTNAIPESLKAGAGDPATYPVGLKTPVRAWVSPSDVQPAALQTSSGGPAPTLRRPHPVKPMNSTEGLHPNSSSIAVSKDLKSISISGVSEKVKVPDSGPYTQLTQEELITLVVKQQAELTKRDEKILELEEYIDNLLVRVIEEQPSILMSLANSKGSH